MNQRSGAERVILAFTGELATGHQPKLVVHQGQELIEDRSFPQIALEQTGNGVASHRVVFHISSFSVGPTLWIASVRRLSAASFLPSGSPTSHRETVSAHYAHDGVGTHLNPALSTFLAPIDSIRRTSG